MNEVRATSIFDVFAVIQMKHYNREVIFFYFRISDCRHVNNLSSFFIINYAGARVNNSS